MPSERVQRQIDRLLDEAEQAMGAEDWATVAARARAAIRLDASNEDALAYLAASKQVADETTPDSPTAVAAATDSSLGAPSLPVAFAGGRYEVRRMLGEGGKKRVYLAHDSLLDRDVAFALIKTEGLDDAGRLRIQREAQAMGRLGVHPNIVSVFDLGHEGDQQFIVTELMGAGDVEGLIERAENHQLPLEQVVHIGVETCEGLEFAHAKGIVHRDLKPGNVWLTTGPSTSPGGASGRTVVKIGDFGLAVAIDRSRLTQAGMMVGTVAYMPPEQALGGEVTPRSDLYSLGAMLYEMVCGRPPFVGDDYVAIISQHLNTPPVAPSWHRPDCPPALEALVLRLLEKEPERRPGTASEVRDALSSVGQTGNQANGQTATEQLAPHEHDPLYRRVFVGREAELKQTHQALDVALSGRGSLAMVVGEPGIGKTALCEQLATYATLRGARTLVGHCYEEGSLSLPYLAFVEAMRSYVLAREPDGLQADLGTGAAEVARIVSEVRDRVRGVELRPTGDPEDDRWRLLQAVTSFLRNASAVQPLLIVLEDLHWADRGTLDLLLHVARNLQGARLLIVGTYRDVEVDRAHPLSGTLAELRRSGDFLRLPLRGLTVDEVHRMYQAVRGQEIAWAQAEIVHRQTEGNPLFVQEVLRYLVEEGIVVREGGRYVAQQGVGAGIPEGLRDVVGRRLSRLSSECNRLLAVAAVIGRDFDLQTLRGVANVSEEDLLAAIEEAVRVGVLEERSLPGSVRYRFAHAFFRQTLYEEMIAPRRLRLHQDVARALESQYATRREEHAAELAEHYGQSTDRADLAKAVEYGELAARRAMNVFAYAEAEEHLGRCIAVQEVLDPEDKLRRCDLLLALGEAISPQENPQRALDQACDEAFAIAERLQDSGRATRAALQACESIARTYGGTGITRPEFQVWSSRADALAREGSTARVYADIFRGQAFLPTSRELGHRYLRNAVEGAQLQAEAAPFFAAAGNAFRFLRALRDRALRRSLAKEAMNRPRIGVRTPDLGVCLTAVGTVLLEVGDRAGAEKAWAELSELGERTRDAAIAFDARWAPAFLALVDGRLDEAIALQEEQTVLAGQQGFQPAPARSFGRAFFHLGRATESILTPQGGLPPRMEESYQAAFLAHLGRHEEASVIRRNYPDIDLDEDETSIQILINLLESALLGGDLETTEALSRRLAPLAGEASLDNGLSVGRLLGGACVLAGKPDEARSYYTRGLDVCEKVRFRPEIALIRLDLAELLLEHYPDELSTAVEHLDFAIAECREMKMQPALERALRLKMSLQGLPSTVDARTSIQAVAAAVEAEKPDLSLHAAPDGMVAILFTDIEDSTVLTDRLGDRRWLALLRRHNELMRAAIKAHGGFEVKTIGDGFMVAFQSARRALLCAIDMQKAVAAHAAAHTDEAVRIRIGVHAGEALKDRDDFYGRNVILASRIAGQAAGGQILVSSVLRELARSGGDLRFDAGRSVQLKGLRGRHRLFEVAWQDPSTGSG